MGTSLPAPADLFAFAWKAYECNIPLLNRQRLRVCGGEVAKRRLTSASLVRIPLFVLESVLLLVGPFKCSWRCFRQ